MAEPTPVQRPNPANALRAELVRLVSLLPVPLALVDEQGRILAWNEHAEQLTGKAAPEVTDLPVHQVVETVGLHQMPAHLRLVRPEQPPEALLCPDHVGVPYAVGPFVVLQLKERPQRSSNNPWNGIVAQRLNELAQFLGDQGQSPTTQPLRQPVLAVPLKSGVPANMAVELRSVDELDVFVRYYRHAPVLLAAGAFRGVLEDVAQVAATELPVLVVGEPGVGKRLVAMLVHLWSLRAAQPMALLHGSSPIWQLDPQPTPQAEALQHPVWEALSSCRRGTVAIHRLELLPKRWLQWLTALYEEAQWGASRTATRLPNVRLICTISTTPAAAHGELHEALDTVGLVQLEVPPLREMPELIEPLGWYFVGRFNSKYRAEIRGFEPQAVEWLTNQAWPGNVRQLRNVVLRACARVRSGWIRPQDLQAALELRGTREEGWQILEALRRAGGNKRKAAQLLGISVSTLYRRLRRLGAL